MHQALEDRALTAMAAVEKIRHPAEPRKLRRSRSVTPLRRPATPPQRAVPTVPTLVLHTEPPRPPQPRRRRARGVCVAQDQLLSAMRDARRDRLEVLRAMRYRDQAARRRDRPDRVMSAPVVETHSLAKTYGLAPVLRDVDLRLTAGCGRVRDWRQRRREIHAAANPRGTRSAERRPRAGLRPGLAQTRGALPASNRPDGASEFPLPESDCARESRILTPSCIRSPIRARPPSSGSNASGWPTLPMPACARSRAGWSNGCLPRARCSPSPRCYCSTSRSRRSTTTAPKSSRR